MRDYFFYAGKSSEDFSLYITDGGVYQSAERVYESVEVPGRNGNLLFEKDNYINVEIIYPAVIVDNFDANYKAMESFLMSQKGYMRLEDSFHPDEYYLATFKKIDGLKHTINEKAGTFRLVFERKPQRFLKSGETQRTITTTGRLKNPSQFVAKPLITCTSTGTVVVNGKAINISSLGGHSYIDIDCDLQEAYSGADNCNSLITLTNGEFPSLDPGVNGIIAGSAGSGGVLVTFNDQCATESASYDWVQLFYQSGSQWYGSPKYGGTGSNNNIAGAQVYIPSKVFRLYWRTDSSVQKWGFKIDSVVPASSGEDVFTTASLPTDVSSWDPVYVGADDLPESNHNYLDNERVGYEVTLLTGSRTVTITPRWWTI